MKHIVETTQCFAVDAYALGEWGVTKSGLPTPTPKRGDRDGHPLQRAAAVSATSRGVAAHEHGHRGRKLVS